MDAKTREMPLLVVDDAGQVGPVPPRMAPSADAAAAYGPVPGGASERVTAPTPIFAERVAPEPQAAWPIAATPVAVSRVPRRWPLVLGAWVGGVVAGMLVLTLALGLFGKPRDLAASNGDPTAAWDTSVTLTDTYLTAQARKNGTGQVQEPVLHVQADGKVALQGKVSLLGRTVPVSAMLQPSVIEGKMQMDMVQLQVGGLPLPEVVVKQIASGVAGAMQPPAGALATTIVKLETSDGKLVLYSKVK